MSSVGENLQTLFLEKRLYTLRMLPTHLADAGQVERLRQLLLDFDFMDIKVSTLGPQPLIEDYQLSKDASLQVIQRSLRREARNVSEFPDLLWQQMYNRLQWESKSLLQILENTRMSTHMPWLKLRTPFSESSAYVLELIGHSNWVWACAISTDSTLIVSGSWDRTLKIWDAQTGEEKATLYGHVGPITSCAISADGTFIVSGSSDQTLKIWDVQTGQERATLYGHSNEIKACTISLDGSYIISLDTNGILKTWDVQTRQEIGLLPGVVSYILAFALSPDGSLLVTANLDGTLDVWDMQTREKRIRLRGDKNNLIEACAVSSDNTVIVTADDRKDASFPDANTLTVWNIPLRQQSFMMRNHTGWIWCCAISPDTSFIISGSNDHTLKVWDAKTGREYNTLHGHTAEVMTCAISSDSTFILSGSKDTTLKLWNPRSESDTPMGTRYVYGIEACTFVANGAFLVTSGGGLKFWDVETIQLHTTIGAGGPVTISNNGTIILCQGGEELTGWDVRSEQKVFSAHRPSSIGGRFVACAISPDNSYIVSISADRTTLMWDFPSGQKRFTLRKPKSSRTATYRIGDNRPLVLISPDSSFIITSTAEDDFGKLRIWDTQAGQQLATLHGHSVGISACALSPDGSFVVSGSTDTTLKIWDIQTAQVYATLQGHTGVIRACVVSLDASYIVSGSDDGKIKVWDAQSGQEQVTLHGHKAAVTTCSISPDGNYIVSGSPDRMLTVWNRQTGSKELLFPATGAIRALAVHPWHPLIACGDAGGNVYLLEMIDIVYGPIIVTAGGVAPHNLTVCCPKCSTAFAIDESDLGTVLKCTHCTLLLRLNRFFTKMRTPSWTLPLRQWWQLWKR